jgi:hypothetical protein
LRENIVAFFFPIHQTLLPTITFPETCAERRWVDVEFIFGNTEIGMTAVDRNSGKKITSRFNLI